MTQLIFWAIVCSLLLSNGMLAISIVRPEFRFWPPPEESSRLYRFTRATSVLAPITMLGVLALAPLDSGSGPFGHSSLFFLGSLFFSVGVDSRCGVTSG